MKFVMTEQGPPLDEKKIAAAEKKMGIKLPEDYRQFLLKNNGGRPDPANFPIRGLENNPFGGIHFFGGIGDNIESVNIDWSYKIFRGRIPKNLLPIASDPMGNLICLSLGVEDQGTVYYWDHDDEHSSPTYRNVYFIASSFPPFLDSIYHRDVSAEVAKVLAQMNPWKIH